MTGIIDSPVFPLGLPDPNVRVIGTGLTDSVDFGTGELRVILAGTGLVDTIDFGSGLLSTGPVDVVDDETDVFSPNFGLGSIAPGPVVVVGTGTSDAPTFGSGSLDIGGISVVDDENDLFSPVFGTGSLALTYAITGEGFAESVSIGSGAIAAGPVTLSGYGIPPEPRVGRGTVIPTYIYFVGPKLTYGHGRRISPLWWVEQRDGISLLKISGVWTEVMYPTGDEIAAAEKAFRGGYRTPITGTEKAELIAAGYGSYIEEE